MLAMRRGCSQRQISAEIQSDELSEMLAYWEYDPFGCEWRQVAKVSATLGNVNRMEGDPYTEEQFLAIPDPFEDEDEDEEDSEDEPPIEEDYTDEEAAVICSAFGIPQLPK